MGERGPGEIGDEAFAAELRQWWSFDARQQHTHSWHTREDFIRDELPKLLAAERASVLSALEREGYVLVPREPSEKMLLAPGEPYSAKVDLALGLAMRRKAWHAMIAARPHQDGSK